MKNNNYTNIQNTTHIINAVLKTKPPIYTELFLLEQFYLSEAFILEQKRSIWKFAAVKSFGE